MKILVLLLFGIVQKANKTGNEYENHLYT